MSELDEFAAKGRALREEDARATGRRSWWPRRRAVSPAQRLRLEAMAGDRSLWLLAMSLVVVGGGFGLWRLLLLAAVQQPWPEIVAGVWGTAGMVATMFAYRRIQERAAGRARAWLAALPFAGNWDAYERTLAKERWKARVTVSVHLQASLADTDARRLADVVRGLVGKASASCNGDRLSVKSPELKTHFQGSGDRESRNSNVRVHAWVRRVLAALIRIHREHPIARVSVEVGD